MLVIRKRKTLIKVNEFNEENKQQHGANDK